MMKFFKFLALFLLGFFLVISPVFSQGFPQHVGYVNDFAEMLSSEFRQSLEEDLVQFEIETSAEIAVVTIDSLEGGSIEDYAVRLFEDWKIGKKGQDNGVLVLVAKEDRKMRIEVGYGLEPVITDGRAGRIIREQIRDAFRQEDYDGGIKQAVEQIKDYIRSGEPPSDVEETRDNLFSFIPFFVIIFFVFVYSSSFLARTKNFLAGGVLGGVLGGILGFLIGGLIALVLSVISLGLFGLLLDYILSKNYQKLKKSKKPTSFWRSWGGFSSGGGGGGFGGFGGGSSGGGGASGGW